VSLFLLQRRNTTRKFIEMFQAYGIASPQTVGLQRHTRGVFTGRTDTAGDQAHSSYRNPVTYLQVAQNACSAAYPAILTDTCASGYCRATGHRRMGADNHVVGNLDLVIKMDILFQDCVVQGATIDGGIGPDLTVVSYLTPPNCGIFNQCPSL